MSFLNGYGLIHGLQFSSFIFQYMGLMVDLLFLGLERASDLAGSPQFQNRFLSFSSIENETRPHIRFIKDMFIKFISF
jgi:pre-mRNA-processing factor 8